MKKIWSTKKGKEGERKKKGRRKEGGMKRINVKWKDWINERMC